MSFTLSTLRSAIRDYTEVDDTVLSDSILERIILNAESRIFRTVDSDDTKFYATSETTIGNRYITVPTGTRIIRYIQITDNSTSDQEFLKQIVYPDIKDNVFVHDNWNANPFPIERENYEFIGQIFDENDNTILEHVQALKEAL